MKRSNFFKTLATLIASPSIIGEIDWDKKPKQECLFDAKRVAEEFNKTGNIYYDSPRPKHLAIDDEMPKYYTERNKKYKENKKWAKGYPEISYDESMLKFHYKPLYENTIELPNGNVLMYGTNTIHYR